jgi:hypothetical protein
MGRGYDTDGATGANAQEHPWYSRTVASDHVRITGAGALQYRGHGIVKLLGVTVETASDQGAATIETGTQQESDAPNRATHRWCVIEFWDGVLDVGSSAPFEVAAARAESSIDGQASFARASGKISTPDEELRADGDALFIAGALKLTLWPGRSDGHVVTHVTLAGDMTGTSLHFQGASLAPTSVAPAGWPILALVGLALAMVAVGGAAGVLHRWGRHRGADLEVPYSAEECETFAVAHAARGDLPQALRWARIAREMAPTSARLWGKEAEILCRMGQWDSALASFERSFVLDEASPDSAAFAEKALHASIAAQRGLDEVETWSIRLLAARPSAVDGLIEVPEVRALVGREAFDSAVYAALDITEGDGSGSASA